MYLSLLDELCGEGDQALLALIRLDPLGRHSRGDTALARDLPALWKALEAAAAVSARQRPDGAVFPLPATAAALEAGTGPGALSSWRRRTTTSRPTPGEAIAEHPVGRLTRFLATASR